jgi:hypothetical protein
MLLIKLKLFDFLVLLAKVIPEMDEELSKMNLEFCCDTLCIRWYGILTNGAFFGLDAYSKLGYELCTKVLKPIIDLR